MKDEEVLKNLYELQGLKSPESEAYIDKWINDTKILIAEESAKTIGLGNGFKAVKKIISTNKKAAPGFAFMLRTSKKNDFIITDKVQALHFKSDCDLPCTSLQKEYADRILQMFVDCKKNCKQAIEKPTRATLDTLIKDYKAQPKEERDMAPLYHFGKGLPYVNAEKLMNILQLFPTNSCWVDKTKGELSPVFMRYETWEGIIMPVRKAK